MDIKDVIYTRRSVRRFHDKPVEEHVIRQMIDAAVQAPSAMNSQPWAFAVVQGTEKLKALSDASKSHLLARLDQMPMLANYRGALEDPEFNIFYNSTSLVIVLAKPNASPDPSTDCALAAENLMLMARDLGLGACWIGFAYGYLNSPEGKRELGIPEGYTAVAPIIAGYPETELGTMDRNPPGIVAWKRN